MLRWAGAFVVVSCLAACGTLLGISGDDEPPAGPSETSPTSDAQSSDANSVGDGGSIPNIDASNDTSIDATKDSAPDAPVVVACNGDAGCVRYVFVTSESYSGGFGAATANTQCKQLADNSAIPDVRGRQWRAWVSTSGQSASQRIQVQGSQRYRLTNDATVADDFDDLVDNSIGTAIDRDESGVLRASQSVWTGTQGNGTWVSTDCSGWTTDAGGNGKVGSTGETDNGWTDNADQPCGQFARLYCFEY